MIWLSKSELNRRRFLKMGVMSGAAVAAAPLISACGTSSTTNSPTSAPAQLVQLGDTVTPPNPEFQAEQVFQSTLEKLTNYEYTVNLQPNSTLGTAQQMLDQMKSGQLQFNKGNTGQMNQLLPAIDAWNLPWPFASNDKLKAAEHGAMGTKTDALLQLVGIKIIAWFDGGTRNVFTNAKSHPIKEPADIKGLKIRVTGPGPLADLFNGLGATAVPLATSLMYSALQTGEVDAEENNVPFFVSQKLDEVAKYFSYTRHSFSIDPLMVSLSWFNQQSKDLQDAITNAANQTETQERTLWAQGETSGSQAATAKGVVFNDDVDIPAFQATPTVAGIWSKNGPNYEPLFTLLKSAQ